MAKEAANSLTGLTRTGSKEFGKSLVKEAQKENTDVLRKQVIGHVQTYLVQIQKQSLYKENCESNLAILRAKIAAIEAGEFKLSTYGVISFNDPDLEKAIVGMLECSNCGHNIAKYGGPR